MDQNISHVKVNDEINVVVRGRVVERGGHMCAIDLFELYQQGWANHPVVIHMPVVDIRSAPKPEVPVVSEVPK